MAETPWGEKAWESPSVHKLNRPVHGWVFELCTLKKIGSTYRLCHHKYRVKASGIEPNGQRRQQQAAAAEGEEAQPRDSPSSVGEDGRAACNVSRARSAVYELAACNPWQYFVTLTLDATKYNRYDLKKWRADFSQWVRNFNRIHGFCVKYLLIPEKHKNGAWHMHGFFCGVPDSELSEFLPGKHPQKLIDGGYRNWKRLADKFGFVSLGRVRDLDAAAVYACKYVTKEMSVEALESGAHMYYASQGLQRAEVIFRGRLLPQEGLSELPAFDWSGEYCEIKTYKTLDEFTNEWYPFYKV